MTRLGQWLRLAALCVGGALLAFRAEVAFAQDNRAIFTYCQIYTATPSSRAKGWSKYEYVTDVWQYDVPGAVSDEEFRLKLEAAVKTAADAMPDGARRIYCPTRPDDSVKHEKKREFLWNEYQAGNWGQDVVEISLAKPQLSFSVPKATDEATADAGLYKTLRLTFKSSNQSGTGYVNASFDLRYRALICAGEIQVAYTIDPKSLKTPGGYLVRWNNQDHPVTPLRQAPMPEVVPIIADVRYGPDNRLLGTLDDKIAGRALGMGCVTGQTKSFGKASVILGERPTPAEIKSFLASVRLARVAPLDVVLVHPDIRVPEYRNGQQFADLAIPGTTQGADAIAKAAELKRRAADAAELKSANAFALQAAEAQNRENAANLAAGRKAQAEYDASMERYRRAVAEAERQRKDHEAKKAAHEARAAAYSACIAGDAAACARYQTDR